MLTLIHQWMPLVNQLGFPIPGWPSPPNTSCADGASGASVSQLKLRSDLHWKVVGAFPKLPFLTGGISPNSTVCLHGKMINKWRVFDSYVKLLEGMLIIQRNIWLGAGWCHLFGQTLLCWAAPWQCLSIRAKSHTSDLGESRPSKCGVTRLSIWNQLQKPFGIRIYHNIIIPYHIISYHIILYQIVSCDII